MILFHSFYYGSINKSMFIRKLYNIMIFYYVAEQK